MTDAPPAGLRPGGRYDAWRRTTPRLLLADVDGTLIGPSDEPSPEVRAAVRRALEAGVHVGIATGRMRAAVERLAAALGTGGPYIVHNGAEVRYEERTVATWPLDGGQLVAILETARRRGLYAEVYVGDGFLVTARDPRAAAHWEILGILPDGTVDVDSVPERALKVTFALFPGDERAGLLDELRAAGLGVGPAGSPLTPEIDYVNVTRADTDKGVALAAGAAALGVDLAEVAVIGDADNDLPMLREAGTAVAMGQAGDEITAAAHLVAPEVSGHGAAVAIEALLDL